MCLTFVMNWVVLHVKAFSYNSYVTLASTSSLFSPQISPCPPSITKHQLWQAVSVKTDTTLQFYLHLLPSVQHKNKCFRLFLSKTLQVIKRCTPRQYRLLIATNCACSGMGRGDVSLCFGSWMMMVLNGVWVLELRYSEQTRDFCNWTERGDR
jgi:hypothetical protein